MTDEQILEAILNGKERIWRFTEQEQVGSSDPADRFLWLAILRAERELAAADFGGDVDGAEETPCRTPAPYRFLNSISQPLPPTFSDLVSLVGQYEDRGQESIVCNAGDGFVNKLRPMRPSSLSGYLAPIANVVYHNRIFPQDRYVLENIYARGAQHFLVLRQKRLEILIDPNGYPVKPTADMIRSAILDLNVGMTEYSGSKMSGEEDSTASSGSEGERLRFYNSDYYISDLQPGRNTVIDAETRQVRFIDPRITLNDPNGPITPVSHFGRRREELPGQIFADVDFVRQ